MFIFASLKSFLERILFTISNWNNFQIYEFNHNTIKENKKRNTYMFWFFKYLTLIFEYWQ